MNENRTPVMSRIFLATACSLAAGFIFMAPLSDAGVPVTAAQPVTRSLSLVAPKAAALPACQKPDGSSVAETVFCRDVTINSD